MRLKYVFFLIFLIMGLIVILVLLAANSYPASTAPPTEFPSGAQGVPVERLEVQVDPTAIVSTTLPEPSVIQASPQQDGPSLLKSHCARCHSAQWLEKIEDPRSEWEGTLSQMERMGVRLTDTEKAILLDYLSSPGMP